MIVYAYKNCNHNSNSHNPAPGNYSLCMVLCYSTITNNCEYWTLHYKNSQHLKCNSFENCFLSQTWTSGKGKHECTIVCVVLRRYSNQSCRWWSIFKKFHVFLSLFHTILKLINNQRLPMKRKIKSMKSKMIWKMLGSNVEYTQCVVNELKHTRTLIWSVNPKHWALRTLCSWWKLES